MIVANETVNLSGSLTPRLTVAECWLSASMIKTFLPCRASPAPKLMLHEGEGARGSRTQRVEIFLNFIGQFDVPTIEHELTPEEIAAEQKLQLQRERKKKNYRTYVEKRQRITAQEQGEISKQDEPKLEQVI